MSPVEIALLVSSRFTVNPAAFVNLAPPTGGPGELATMLYFRLSTLTTTG
jgi:hypothetical protein